MAKGLIETDKREHAGERDRLAALLSTHILDTPAEENYDSITRLCAEYFKVDTVLLGFVDESRIWIKSYWGEPIRELPRSGTTFQLVLERGHSLAIDNVDQDPAFKESGLWLRRIHVKSLASAPIRSADGHILGALNIYSCQRRRRIAQVEMRMLESLAEIVSNQIELGRLKAAGQRRLTKPKTPLDRRHGSWPRPADLREALERQQFVLYYQPEIELPTRRVVGLEALIRWEHPDLGLIPPMSFIPVAEDSGMILPIGDWGLSEACLQIHNWMRDFPGSNVPRVSVNLSARQFSRKGLADHVEALLQRSGIPSKQLGLEMTESSLPQDAGAAIDVLRSLRDLGVMLSMDDFGTGYSSLRHLHTYPFHVLKIDRCFVSRISEGEQPLQIVRAILDLARALGMDAIAEGVETVEQDQLLQTLGCRFGQGYLYAKPMPAEEIGALLNERDPILRDYPAEPFFEPDAISGIPQSLVQIGT